MWLQFSCIFQRRHKCEIHPLRTNRGKIGFDWVHICRFLHLWSNTEHTAVIVGIYLLVHKNSNQFRLQSASTCVWTNVSDYEYSKGSQGQVLRWCNTFHPTQCDSMDEWQIPWICCTSCHTLPANFLALNDCTVSLLQCYLFCWKKLWLNHGTKAGRGIVFPGPLPRVTTEKVKELHWWGGEEGDGGVMDTEVKTRVNRRAFAQWRAQVLCQSLRPRWNVSPRPSGHEKVLAKTGNLMAVFLLAMLLTRCLW